MNTSEKYPLTHIIAALRAAEHLWPFTNGHKEEDGITVRLSEIPGLLREAQKLLRNYEEVEWF